MFLSRAVSGCDIFTYMSHNIRGEEGRQWEQEAGERVAGQGVASVGKVEFYTLVIILS